MSCATYEEVWRERVRLHISVLSRTLVSYRRTCGYIEWLQFYWHDYHVKLCVLQQQGEKPLPMMVDTWASLFFYGGVIEERACVSE